jgi:GxxExxY protein
MEIHKNLGLGLKEINYNREAKFQVRYKDYMLRNPYIADFIVYDTIVLEIKSAKAIIDTHVAQGLSYLAVSGMKLALLINF